MCIEPEKYRIIYQGGQSMMKKLLVKVVVLSCLLLVWLPISASAQTQYPYLPLSPVYQPYQPYQSYQPYLAPSQPYGQPYMQPYGQTYGQQPYMQPYGQLYGQTYGQQPYMQPVEPLVFPYPSSQLYPPCQLTQCQSKNWCSAEQMYRCGLSLVYARQYDEAIQGLSMFLRFYPRSSLADNAVYWIGECYYARKHYQTALSYFHRVLAEYPRGNKVADAKLKTALAHISLRNYAEGCRWLNEVIYRHPRSEAASKAYRWLGYCGGGSGYFYPDHDYSYGNEPTHAYSDWLLPKNW
jgi:tol-pal system protein YbgF